MYKRYPTKHLYEQMVTIMDDYAHALFNFSTTKELKRILQSMFNAVRMDVEVIPTINENSKKLYYTIYIRYGILDNRLLKLSELKTNLEHMAGGNNE